MYSHLRMAETGRDAGATSTYASPRIEDYGSLTDLTASFDPDTVASLAQGAGSLSLAVVSVVMVRRESSSSSSVLDERISRREGGGDSSVLDDRVAGGRSGGGGVGSSGGGGTGGGEGAGSGGGGRLPFSGYSVFVTAAVGAALASAGAGARAALRRRQS